MQLISFNIPNEINPKLFTNKILNNYKLPNDIVNIIQEYIYGNHNKPIKFIYEVKDRKTWDLHYGYFNIDYDLFVYRITNFIIYKHIYFDEKRLIPYLRNDKLFFINNINHNIIYDYYFIFVTLYNEIYSYFYNNEKYECLYYNSYHDINEKCYNLLNNYL